MNQPNVAPQAIWPSGSPGSLFAVSTPPAYIPHQSERAMTTVTPAKPKPTGKKAEPLSPAEQRRRFDALSRELETDSGETLDPVFETIVPAKVRQEGA